MNINMKPFAEFVKSNSMDNFRDFFAIAADETPEFNYRRFKSPDTAVRFLNVAVDKPNLRPALIKAVKFYVGKNDGGAHLKALLEGVSGIHLITMSQALKLRVGPRKEERIRIILDAKPDVNKVVDMIFLSPESTGTGAVQQVAASTEPAAPATIDEDALRTMVKDIISEGIDFDAGDKLIEMAKEALKEASKEYRQIEVKVGDKKAKKIDGIMPKEFERILQLAAARKNVLMVGPSGCGKTFLAEKVAEALSLPYASQSCSAGMSEAMLAGWLIPIGTGGKFVYVSSQFVEKYEKGGVFLLDEIDGSDANTMVFFNQALAQGHFFLPQRHEKPMIKKHENFVCLAAANTFGNGADMMFVGRNQLDAATLDRFRIGLVQMDYSQEVEAKLVEGEILEWGRAVRSAIYSHKLRRIMSTRFMLDCTDMKGVGWTLEDCKKSYFSDWSDHEKNKLSSNLI